jgi:hypothetical protein
MAKAAKNATKIPGERLERERGRSMSNRAVGKIVRGMMQTIVHTKFPSTITLGEVALVYGVLQHELKERQDAILVARHVFLTA